MAELTVDETIHNEEEMNEYINKCIQKLFSIEGNMPFSEFRRTGASYKHPNIVENERYYLCKNPFGISGYIRSRFIPQLPTAIRLRSLTTHETIIVDIRLLLGSKTDLNRTRIFGSGVINNHLRGCIRVATPYLTLREAMQELISFIGERHIYFTGETVEYYDESLKRNVKTTIWSCHFAEYVNHKSK